jgi:ParB family chromosome partitioning protein
MSSKRSEPYKGKIKDPLAALYGDISSADNPTSIPLEEIQLPKRQPRRYFDPQAQQNLVQSVRQHGILQPLLVRPLATGKYELVAGERRYRAAKEVGLTDVPIIKRELNDTEAFQVALVENLQREDLNPIEETESILRLLALELSLPEEDVSSLLYRLKHDADRKAKQSGHNVMPSPEDQRKDVGHNVMPNESLEQIQSLFARLGSMTWESFVKNRLPLLSLSADILEAVSTGNLQYTKAIALSRIKDDKARSSALKQVTTEDWSLAQIKEHIKTVKPPSAQTPLKQQLDVAYQKAKKAKVWEDPNRQERLAAILKELEALLEG